MKSYNYTEFVKYSDKYEKGGNDFYGKYSPLCEQETKDFFAKYAEQMKKEYGVK